MDRDPGVQIGADLLRKANLSEETELVARPYPGRVVIETSSANPTFAQKVGIPEFTSRISFKIGDVLRPDDLLAQWIVNLGRASNDVMIANRRLYAGFELETPPEEHFYDIKAIALHVWELAKFLRDSSEVHEVSEFVASLSSEIRTDYMSALELIFEKESDSSQTKRFKNQLISARDQSSHYSRIDHKLLKSAIAGISQQDGEVWVGPAFKDFNAKFASDVDTQMFFPMGEDSTSFEEFSKSLSELVPHLLRFARNSIDTFLVRREAQLTIEDAE